MVVYRKGMEKVKLFHRHPIMLDLPLMPHMFQRNYGAIRPWKSAPTLKPRTNLKSSFSTRVKSLIFHCSQTVVYCQGCHLTFLILFALQAERSAWWETKTEVRHCFRRLINAHMVCMLRYRSESRCLQARQQNRPNGHAHSLIRHELGSIEPSWRNMGWSNRGHVLNSNKRKTEKVVCVGFVLRHGTYLQLFTIFRFSVTWWKYRDCCFRLMFWENKRWNCGSTSPHRRRRPIETALLLISSAKNWSVTSWRRILIA